ncbi:TPA: hypothetical protein EYP38_01995, partial [Candidatus Micrarchaeota archaeon]|nr:hypothetical protein [Candidatus Micrarchaeota archaeon]
MTSFKAIAELEITLKKGSADDEKLKALYATQLFDMPGIMKPDGFFESFGYGKRVTAMLRDIIDAALSPDFSEEDLSPLTTAAQTSRSFPHHLIYTKILEEIAIRSTNDKVWQRAVCVISDPLYKPVRNELSGTSKMDLAIASLKRIYAASDYKKKQFMAGVESEVRKSGFIVETFCGALFDERAELIRKMVLTLCGMDCSGRDLQILHAALLAFQMSAMKGSSPVFQRLAGDVAEIDEETGVQQLMSIVNGEGYQVEQDAVFWHIIEGSREIFTPKLWPHRWSLELQGDNGPIPTLKEGELRMVLLEVLDRIPSGPTALTVLDAWIKLVVPHVYGIGRNGNIDAEPSVRRAFGRFGESVTTQLSRSGALMPMHVAAFNGLFLGKPQPIGTEEVDSSTLLLLSPATERIISSATRVMAGDAYLTRVAKEALLLGLMHGCDERGAEVGNVVGRNIRIMRDRT